MSSSNRYACLNCGMMYPKPLEECTDCGGVVAYVGDSDHE